LEKITSKAKELAANADKIAAQVWPEIKNDREYELAATARKDAKDKIKGMNNERLNITRPIDAAKSQVMAFFKPHIMALEKFISSVDGPMIVFAKAKEVERLKEEKRLREEAEATAKKEREEAEQVAADLEKEGEHELAQEIINDVEVAATIEPVTVKKKSVAGASTRTIDQISCTDKMELIKAIAAGDVPERLVDINQANLKRYFDVMGKVPAGCVNNPKTIMVSR